jgi:GT2 family glycosyltransferase
VLGGALLQADDNLTEFAGSGVDDDTGLPNWQPIEPPVVSIDGLTPTASVSGAALFTDRSVFETLGFFDDKFYLYYDEVDWCFRATAAGHLNWIVPKAVVRHLGYASSGGEVSPLRTYFMLRNMLLFAEKHSTRQQRRTLARRAYWDLRNTSRDLNAGPWPMTLLTNPDIALSAKRRGVLDYVMRRFGDCPSSIRVMNEVWRSQSAEAQGCGQTLTPRTGPLPRRRRQAARP